MNDFQILFTTQPRSITSPDGLLVTHELPSAASQDSQRVDDRALETLQQISTELAKIDSLVRDEIDQCKRAVTSLAVDIAHAVLNGEMDLVEQRVKQYVSAALDASRPDVAKTVYVHPSCLPAIHAWADDSQVTNIDFRQDPALQPGDCRIETGDVGILAAFQDQLGAIAAKLSTTGEHHDC